MAYPVENMFRKPAELIAATASLATAVAVPYYGAQTGLSPWVTSACAVALVWHAGWRTYCAVQIIKFQLGLRWLPNYALRSGEIPWSKREMFLGMGFWWSQTHTQRLFLSRLPQHKHLKARNDWYLKAREYERDHPQAWLTKLTSKASRWNPVSPLPPVGGDPAIHGVEPNEYEIWSNIGERVGHTLVLGTTRVGKTRLAELLITQDIHRGDVVIVFDPKGDKTLLQRMYAEASRAGRSKDFWFFHLGHPELSDRYSPISSIGRITEVATRVANPLPGEGNSAAFKQFVWLYINIIARAASALGMSPTYKLIYQYAADLDSLAERYFELWLDRDHPQWRAAKEDNDYTLTEKMMQSRIQQTGRSIQIIQLMDLLSKTGWHDPIAAGLISVLSNNKSKYQALINSLFPLLEKLTTGKVAELLSPDWDNPKDSRRIFDWDKIMDTGGVVYVGLDSLSDHEVASAVGNAMFADLTSTAGRRYKFGTQYGQSQTKSVEEATKVAVHADEFNELIGDEFVPLLNKAGGAGYQVTVYTQTWDDVEAKIGNRAKAGQIGGNLNTLIMLRVKNIETAEILTNQLPEVEVATSTMVSGSSDVANPDEFTDFSANAQDRLTARQVPTLQPADLTSLPKGQAFALLEGGQLAKIRLPLPVMEADDAYWPAHMEAVFDAMQRKYVADVVDDAEDSLTVEGAGRGY